MTPLGEQCLKLKAENPKLGYKRIAKMVGCTHSAARYHLSERVRAGYRNRQSRNRRINMNALKSLFGGQCHLCGYNRCTGALHFHHLNPAGKDSEVSAVLRQNGKAAALIEAHKCVLVCANCHQEIHDGLVVVEPNGKPTPGAAPGAQTALQGRSDC